MNLKLKENSLDGVAELLGDLHPLTEQIGSVEGLVTLDMALAALQLQQVKSPAALRQFLEQYRDRILYALELPAIFRAFVHAGRNEVRELVALDNEQAGNPILREFASASRRVGQAQLKRLRPLRDLRVVQRYLKSVESGDAQGLHTLVYGLSISVYSLPARQGLMNYARETLRGFIHAAIPLLNLTERQGRELLDDLCAGLQEAVEETLRGHGGPFAAAAG